MTTKSQFTVGRPLADHLTPAKTTKRLGTIHYRRFFENAVEGAFISTPDGRYLSVNPALARIYGYAKPLDRALFLAKVREHLETPSELPGQTKTA